MRLKYLFIDGYKNLNELKLYFEDEAILNVLLGNNGSGKSNILEALSIIFSTIVLGETNVGFSFAMKYCIDEVLIEICNEAGIIEIKKDGKKVPKKNVRTILPTALFLYYAGETDRVRTMAEKVTKRFSNKLKNEEAELNFFTHLSVEDFGSAILATHVFRSEVCLEICTLVGVDEVCSPIEIFFGKPSWGKTKGAAHFWNAQGVIGDLLNKFSKCGVHEAIDQDSFKIVITDASQFKDDRIGAMGFFKELKLLSQADVLKRIEFKVRKGNEEFSYRHLSEGEKQLGQLLAVLDITKDYKSIFLLDEFDSYLHPNWQRRFAELISQIGIRGQILFTTHSAATLGKMKRENVFLLKNGRAFKPGSATFNRNISELLEEHMDVSLRPPNIEKMITDFKASIIVEKNKVKALKILEELKGELSEEDPFFITANTAIARLERMKNETDTKN